jgi:cytidine deaminase
VATTPTPLDPDHAALVEQARRAARNSYSPYSHFPVGAAVLCADGTEILGCNVENASYGLTICAERNALFAATALGHRDLPAIAVTCPAGDPAQPETLMPCGACRQVIVELLADDGVIVVDHVGTFTKAELLPQAFKLN